MSKDGSPWVRTYVGIRGRCNWRGSPYHRKGIKCQITKDELPESDNV